MSTDTIALNSIRAQKHRAILVKRPSLERSIQDSLHADWVKTPSQEIIDLIGEEVAYRPAPVSFVADEYSDFTPLPATIGGVFGLLAEHREQRKKEQYGLVPGDLRVQRTNECILSMTALGVDIDGNPSSDISFDALCAAAPGLGIVATTHSHGSTRTYVEAHKGEAWLIKNGYTCDTAFDEAMAAAFKPKLPNPRPLYDGRRVNRRAGPHYAFDHEPLQRYRIITFFTEDVLISETGLDGWRLLYHACTSDAFGSVYDRTCANAARVFWTPAHPPGAPFDVRIINRPPLDWRPTWERVRVGLEAEREKQRKRAEELMNAAPADLDEVRHYLSRISASCDRDTWKTCVLTVMSVTKGDGRALLHAWSATAPEKYDESALDSLCDWAEEHEPTHSMGSLVRHANECDPDGSLRREMPTARVLPVKKVKW